MIPIVIVHDMSMQTLQIVGTHVRVKAALDICATNTSLYKLKPENDLFNSACLIKPITLCIVTARIPMNYWIRNSKTTLLSRNHLFWH